MTETQAKEAVKILRRLATLKVGPASDNKRAEWIGKVFDLADRSAQLLKNVDSPETADADRS